VTDRWINHSVGLVYDGQYIMIKWSLHVPTSHRGHTVHLFKQTYMYVSSLLD
jgi:hypothetical protein